MQNESDVIGSSLAWTFSGATDLSRQAEDSGRSLGLRVQFKERNVEALRDFADRRIDALLDHDRFRFEVLEIELELIGAVAGIERRCRCGVGHAEERGRHLGAVRQHDRDAVPTS